MINLHPSKNQCQTPQSDSNSWWVRRTVPIDSGSTLGRKGWLGASYPIGSTMVSSSADALAASADPSASVSETASLGFGNE